MTWDARTLAALELAYREARLDRAHARHVSCQTAEIDLDTLSMIGELEDLIL